MSGKGKPCPFCGTLVLDRVCENCDRDTSGPRRVCGKCRKMSPQKEASCCHCGASFRSELRWKVPLIILLFLLAIIISTLIRVLG